MSFSVWHFLKGLGTQRESGGRLHKDRTWAKYVPFWNPSSPMPIYEESFQHFRLITKHGDIFCKSMLTILELAYLYSLGRDQYTGVGQVVDLGPYCGVGTFALASGLECNPCGKHGNIFSYDIFLVEGYDWFFEQGTLPPTRSVFPIYFSVLRDYLHRIVPVPGDLLKMKWTGDPIEILFIDIAKSWLLNNWVVSETFPCLVPEKSIVVQQDYVHYFEWWLQVVMEYYSDRFELLGVINGASGIFRSVAPISYEEARKDLSVLSLGEKIDLLERAAARVPPSAAEVLKCGRAKCLIEHGQYEDAECILKTVVTSVMTDDPVLNFAGIAQDNLHKVENLLKQRRQSSGA